MKRYVLGAAIFLIALPAISQQLVTGDVYSYVKDGTRFYSSKLPPPGAEQVRTIAYSFIEGSEEVVAPFFYRCPLANGSYVTVGRPYYGCTVVGTKKASAAASRTFHGYRCTQDCSGHQAGYAWAEEKGIADPNDCGGRSQSFIEGCKAWAEEN